MNITEAILEIGLLETCRVIARHPGSFDSVSLQFPEVNSRETEERIQSFAGWIVQEKKELLFLMLPELALMETLAFSDWKGSVIIALPSDLDTKSRERIFANMPDNIRTEFVQEGTYPSDFRPDNGIVLCMGILPEGYRPYLLPECCRMMSLYKAFKGRRIFLSCFGSGTKAPELGWVYAEDDFFNGYLAGDV
ncbi:MAG: hypothetical protein FWH04_06440 [Oscillospiraceae bacterium]|nr:hypothetical protein [Oscillospiraceae bacterium]